MSLQILNHIFRHRIVKRPFWVFFATLAFFSSISFFALREFFPTYFSFLFLFLLGMVFFFRAIGFCLALVCLIPLGFWAYSEKAIWELFLLYSLAIGYFTVLLACEEDDVYLVQTQATEPNREFSKEPIEDQKQQLQQLIDQLKEEAERRYLEFTHLQKAYEAIQLQNSQLIHENQSQNKEKERLISHINELTHKTTIEKETLNWEISKLNECLKGSQDEVSVTKQELYLSKEKNEKVMAQVKDKDLADIMGKYNQLREQFEEKSKVLSQARRDLFQTQGKLLAIEKEQFEESHYQFPQNEMQLLASFEKTIEENTLLYEEIKNLEDIVSSFLN